MFNLRELLIDFNPWWKGIFEVDFRPRAVYSQIRKFHTLPQMTALTGLRRVGKSTLLKKVIKDEISSGTDPKKILYFSFDEARETGLREILKAYQEITGVDVPKEKTIVLFDEIQKVNDWENKIKTVYDLYKDKTKIYVSGSESLFLEKKSKETLAGRIFYFKIGTLTFPEYLDFTGKKFDPIELHEKELLSCFREFTLSQGFPELVGITDRQIIQKYLQEGIIEKIIYRDMPAIFPIKEPSILESIIKLLMEEPGQMIDMDTLAAQLRTTRQTISNYLSYLEQSFLVRKLYNYSSNKRKTERKLKKYYPEVISTALAFKEDDYSKSKVLEWIMVTRLNAEFFWRNQYQNEVDIVLIEPKLTPIEVKLSETWSKGIEVFSKKYKTKKNYIVTQYEEKNYDTGTQVIPAFKYLLRNATTEPAKTFD